MNASYHLLTLILVAAWLFASVAGALLCSEKLGEWIASKYEHPGGTDAGNGIGAVSTLIYGVIVIGALLVIYFRLTP